MVMWVIGLWIGKYRPCARGRPRLIVGPSFASASATTRSSADRVWVFSAFATALLSTRATSSAACCGMKRSAAAASSTGLPWMADVTSRAFRVEPRRDLAVADTRTGSRLLLRAGGAVGPTVLVPSERAGGRELAEPMADHVLGHVDRDVLPAVVDGDGVADEVGEDDRRAGPGLDDPLLVALVHLLDAAEEPRLDVRPLLDRTGHSLLLRYFRFRRRTISRLDGLGRRVR